MHGTHEVSPLPRAAASIVHLAAVLAAIGLLGRDGVWSLRDGALILCSAIYLARVVFGLRVMLRRRFGWAEAGIVGGLWATVHIGNAWLGAGAEPGSSAMMGLALALYAAGSYLNTASEYRRHVWKRNPDHRGRLYTGGLFRYSMHINYFGDTLLFTGFALLTGSPWALLLPGAMTASFIFQHIPNLDRYLAERYGEPFVAYAARTRKFVPFIY